MQTEDIRHLSSLKILNMNRLFKEAGISHSEVASKIYRDRPVSDYVPLLILTQLALDFHTVIDTLKLNPEAIISGVLSHLENEEEEQAAISNLYNETVTPFGYVRAKNGSSISVYCDMDRFVPRAGTNPGERQFIPIERIAGVLKRADCELTQRGNDYLDEITRERSVEAGEEK